jgi:plastocyanin
VAAVDAIGIAARAGTESSSAMDAPVRRLQVFDVRPFVGLTILLSLAVAPIVVRAAPTRHDVQISAHKYSYRIGGADRAELHVKEGEVVHVTFTADDIAHSFTIDEPYRISKRSEPGKPVTFDFVADKPGSFAFYCDLAIDERCRKELRGTLIVEPQGR